MDIIRGFQVRLWPILAAILISFAYYHSITNRGNIELEIVTPVNADKFKIYWQTHDAPYFHESRHQSVIIYKNLHKYHLFIPDIKNIRKFRIDPMEREGFIHIKKLVISQPGIETLEFNNTKSFSNFEILEDISAIEFEQKKGLKINTTGIDSQLLLTPQISQQSLPWVYFIHLALLAGAVYIGIKHLPALSLRWQFVPYLLIFIIALVIVMMAITGTKHPDEYVHLNAVRYYAQYFLPPPMNDPSLASTFSVYGYSRVNNMEVFYNIGGAFLYLFKPLFLSELVAARLFNVLLLIGLTWYSLTNKEFRYFTIPLLISAQTWYLFSYVNSDALALFLAILLSYQAASKQSALHGILTQDNATHSTFKILCIGLLFGLLLLVKINFYVFLLFLSLYLLWRIFIGDFPNQALLWRRLILISLIGTGLFGVRYGWDISQNGFGDRNEKIVELSKQHSLKQFHPDTPLAQKAWNLQLKERGLAFSKLLSQYGWFEGTFASSFGSYGYTEFYGSKYFYSLVKIIGMMLIAIVLFGVVINAPPSVLLLFFITLGSAFLLLGVSLWQSWTQVLQAQGRYLLPVLPMIGVYYYHARHYVNQTIVVILTLALFVLAVYSFVFVGLLEIAKLRHPLLLDLF